ncbi:MAG: hypothetical protein QGH39_12295 [Candidatus Thermoplasmatota archaeon]|nr:hypothetical protein [Candidatus Thermoplasmatota archaeon]
MVLLAVFLIIPTLINIGVVKFHPKMDVGIVLVDDCNMTYARIAKEGFEYHHEYFRSKVITDYRFNSSGVKVQDNLSLTTDFFDNSRSEILTDKYEVDVILYVTDKRINNWEDHNGGAWWGQASVETRSAVMTVTSFMSGDLHDNERIQSIAVHEVGHLLGFIHPPVKQSRSNIMNYADPSRTLNFSSYHNFKLPFHLLTYKVGTGYRLSFGDDGRTFNMAFIKLLADLFFLPYIIGFGLVMIKFINIFVKQVNIHWAAVGISSSTGFLVHVIMVQSFMAIGSVLMIMALIAFVYYLGMAVVVKERGKQRKNPRKNKHKQNERINFPNN